MSTRPTGGRTPSGRPDATAVSGEASARGRYEAHGSEGQWPEVGTRPIAVAAGPAQPSEIRTRPSRFMRRLRRTGKAGVYTLVPALLLAMFAIGITYVRLRHGPITFDFLVPPIERGINAELANVKVDIAGAELRLGEHGGLEFRLRDLSIIEADGDPILAAPLAAVSISTAALMRGRVVPARIELIDPELTLSYSEEQGFVFQQPPAAPSADAPAASRAAKLAPGEVPKPVEAKRPTTATPARQINLAKMLSDASRRARQRADATSYLSEFAISNATIVVDYAGQRSAWNVPTISVDMNHRKRRSIISGHASVASPRGPWSFSFVTDESEKTGRILVKATVRDLVPSTLAAAAPPLALLQMFQMPVGGDATVELSSEGDVDRSELALELGAGQISHPGVADAFQVSAGLFKMVFSGADRRWELQSSPVKWVGGSANFSGTVRDVAVGNQPPTWMFNLQAQKGVFEAAEFNVPPVTIDTWTVSGSVVPRRGFVDVSEFRFAGGGGEAFAKSTTQAGPNGQSTIAEMKVSAMPLATLKTLWPRAVAPGARDWVGERVSQASFKGGNVRYVSGDYLRREQPEAAAQGERLTASFEVADGTFTPMAGMPQAVAPRALIQLENNALEVTVPDAALLLPGDRKVPVKAVRLYAPDVMGPRPDSEITLSSQSALAPFLEVVESLPVRAVRQAAPFPKAGEGKIDAHIKVKVPLIAKLSADDVGIEGKARITDGRFGKVGGNFDVQGFTLNLDLTDTALDAKGDLLVNGVPAKIVGQRLFSPGSEPQPPIRITASLDEADRTQLGMDINDLIRGVVPIEVSLQSSPMQAQPVVKLKANLTNAEIALDQIGWKKPAGRQAVVDADIVSGKQHKTELQNFKISGDDIAAEGWIGIGADNKLREFFFPAFSLNVVSRLEVQGTLGNDNIWNIKANGPTFDGRDLFKSFFTIGAGDQRKAPTKGAGGTDLTAEIGNVLGHDDLSLRGFKLKLSSRNEKLASLDARGTIDGSTPFVAVLDQSTGARRLLVDSPDAGKVLKLVDFYPNMQGGRLRLEVDLDGRGAAEKTGILWVDDFKVLGDPIVSEVVGSADQGRPAISGGQRVTREVFQFERMRAPFSVGYNQFVLEESYVRGPLMGANLRGKVDLKAKRVNFGGTYIPLQGLNSALGNIPLLGQILSGAQGEGIFGITFAVQGPTANPQVLVNPLSLVAPGIFREMFQMTGNNPKVQVREDRAPAKPAPERVRASSAPAVAAPKAPAAPRAAPQNQKVDGWSTSMSPN